MNPLRLSYDGHGLNRADGADEAGDGMPLRGERLITWQRRHRDQGGDYVVPDEMARTLGPVLAAAPEMLEALESTWNWALVNQQRAGTLDVQKIYAAIAKAKGEQ